MTGNKRIYRLTVIDSRKNVRGIISGLRVIETMTGRRGAGIKKRVGKGIEPLFKQPIKLFINEYLHKLSSDIPLNGLISYIMENFIGHVVLVDQMNVLQGVVTERCILSRSKIKGLDIKVSDIMKTEVHTASPEQTLLDATTIMTSYGIRKLPIIDQGQIKGVITVTDILKHLIDSDYHIEAIFSKKEIKNFLVEKIKEIDLIEPEVLHVDDELDKLCDRMDLSKPIRFLILNNNEKIAGIISSRDLVTKIPKIIGTDRFTSLID
jgi:CBS domain-containing protein